MTAPQNRAAGHNPDPGSQTAGRPAWRNTPQGFGRRAQWLHAVLGTALLVMLALGTALALWPENEQAVWQSVWQDRLVTLHKGLGLWVLIGGVVWFVSWLIQTTPQRLPSQSRSLYRLAKLVHQLLLWLCIVMPVSGWIMVSAWGDTTIALAPFLHLPSIIAADPAFADRMLGVHIILAWTLAGLFALHLAGVIYHAVIMRDGLVARMWPGVTAGNRTATDTQILR